MSRLYQDLRLGVRNLLRQPAVSLIVIGILALGIGGTTAIFSIFHSLFLQPLPVSEPWQLVDIDEEAPTWNLPYTGVAAQDFAAWREQNSTFEGMSAYWNTSYNVTGNGVSERLEATQVTHDLLRVMRLRPVIGRGFLPEDDKPGAARVAMIGYGMWKRMFGGRADVLGQGIQLDAQGYEIIGVLPEEAVAPGRGEIWTALRLNVNANNGWWMGSIGRLKPGVSLEQARADLTRIHKAMIPGRDVNKITTPKIQPFRERALGNARTPMIVMLGAVAVVLLIACVNVAGLMLARGTARAREMRIRAALGATRSRIIAQLLTESAVLAGLGGTLGVLLGIAGAGALVSMMPEGRVPQWVIFGTNPVFLAFSALLTTASAVLFGLWPALDASRVDLRGALAETGGRSSQPAGRRRSLHALVAAEVALAVVLLVAAGLLVEAFRKLNQVDPGFRVENVLTYRVSIPQARYPKDQDRIRFFRQLVERTRALPGVVGAGAATAPPLGGHWGNFFEVEGGGTGPLSKEGQDPVTLMRAATPGYFEAMGLRLVEGRWLQERDGVSDGTRAVIVNESFAKRHWPGQSAVGKRLRHRGSKGPWSTVVGVAADIKHYGLDQPMRPGVYFPGEQVARESMVMVIRSAGDPAALTAAARGALRGLDPELPMYQVRTMTGRVGESLWLRRTYSWLLGVFSVVALAMAVGGIYGVISYSVGRRTPEIGIRMALGADCGAVLRQVLRGGMTLAAGGLALGLGASLITAKYLEELLFGVDPRDPAIYAAVASALLVVAAAANLAPALRASRVDPCRALRDE